MNNINVHMKIPHFYVNLKEFYSEVTNETITPGEVLEILPEDLDVRDTLVYTTMKEYSANFMDDLMTLAYARGDIDFSKLRGKVSSKNIQILNRIKKSNNFSQLYITKKLVGEYCFMGALVVLMDRAYVARKVIPRTTYVDDMPFVLYKKLEKKISGSEKFKIDILNLGYYVPEEEILIDVGSVRYYLPNLRTSSNPKLSQLFNHYLMTGIRLIPMTDLSNEI